MQTASSTPYPQNRYLGLKDNLVVLKEYSDQWPVLFHQEQQRILHALEVLAPAVEHIGSTAIPGMPAKPIVDIAVGIENPRFIQDAIDLLQTIDYISKGEMGIPGREFFTLGNPISYHLHLVQLNGPIWSEHLLFREKLTTDADLASRYVEIKKDLAARYPSNRKAYTVGKANFIESALADSR